ncbi:MAG: GDP-mannose 4,6-dehydratase, partial [Flavobacteriaceae bacterium]|nr:GDP-mannose 4,6-dehydratase [Flavobacteriaceae bacterium]
IQAAFTEEAFPLCSGSLNHLRSYTYITDVCQAIEKCILNSDHLNGQIINIGNEEENTTEDAIKLVEKTTGKKIKLSIKPPREGDQLRTCAINQKAQALLNYSPSTSLKEGIRQHILWYQKHSRKD